MSHNSNRLGLRILAFAAFPVLGSLLLGGQALAKSPRLAQAYTTDACAVLKELPASCGPTEGTPIEDCDKGNENGDIIIGEGAEVQGCEGTVVVDKKHAKVGKITINTGGTLIIDDAAANREAANKEPVDLETDGIQINDGGTFRIGAADCPIGTSDPEDKVEIQFVGPKPDDCGHFLENPDSPQCPGWQKGIEVGAGGTLRMYGAKGVVPKGGVSWTYLSKPAGPSEYNLSNNVLAPVTEAPNIIHLAADVTQGSASWQEGDWIAIATTSFSPWEAEFVKIDSLVKDDTGTKITLAQDLSYYHFGGPNPGAPGEANYNAGADLNYGVDERAAVGLVSRNILLTSDTERPKENKSHESTHWGGEIRIHEGFEGVAIQGVELQKFGKEQLGSYPIHFHRAGDLTLKDSGDKLIDSNSVHHSYNKCMTIHSTQNLELSNNVCARITGHIFYQEIGDEFNISFISNLGLGAMSNSFNVNAPTQGQWEQLIKDYYWVGDNMDDPLGSSETSPHDIGFDQLNIFDTDDQANPVHGLCGIVTQSGILDGLGDPKKEPNKKCVPPKVYFEHPSGFWITNPSAKLEGNLIAGCQGTGKAYFYVPPGDAEADAVKFIPIGAQYAKNDPDGNVTNAKRYGVFENNRASACYHGLYDDPDGMISDSLYGYEGGIHDKDHQAVVDEFDGVTLSRIRDRGVWLRPSFYVVKDARIATTRDGVSLVTSGGVDGNYAGVWGLLKDSTMVGISTNNVDRWGPCGAKVNVNGVGQVRGGLWGCIDRTNPAGGEIRGGVFPGRGYPDPDWPIYGFLIYDGPPLILHDRFVNFRVSPGSQSSDPEAFPAADLLTVDDDTILESWTFKGIPGFPEPPPPYTQYEGSAAFVWFNANQSAYPAATTTAGLSFSNVDLRHQVYTERVNLDKFADGDENTTILDLDGTLAGVLAVDGFTRDELPAISLNNLGINASANSVDECLSEGAEDRLLEGRPTAAMVPSALAQLEFEMAYPPTPLEPKYAYLGHTQTVTFTKNSPDFTSLEGPFSSYHGKMALKSRNGLGDWEPKVTNGYGYTVTASKYTAPTGQVAPPDSGCDPDAPDEPCAPAGIGKIVDITLTDIVNAPTISEKHPFYVQIGICYTNKKGGENEPPSHPGDDFTVTRGFRSYGGGAIVYAGNTTLQKYYNELACHNLDSQQTGVASNKMPEACPAASAADAEGMSRKVETLNRVDSIKDMTMDGELNGEPNLDNYFYDAENGWLFLWVRQDKPNAHGPSPLGNCTGEATDPDYCPSKTTGHSYYVCPAEGCPSYRIVVNDPDYVPGPSDCGDPYTQGYEWPAGPSDPSYQNTLVVVETGADVEQKALGGKDDKFPHYTADGTTPIICDLDQPPPEEEE